MTSNIENKHHPLSKVKNTLAISSCKGGVGKSTLAAHLALELVQRGLRVGLVDVDIYGPSIPSLFNLIKINVKTNEFKQLIPIEKLGLKIMSFGFLLGDGPAVMRGPMVSQYVQQIILGTEWGELDYLLIDMPPGTGDTQLTITQSINLNGAIILTTPQTLSLIDVARGILMFEKVKVPILGVIENMAYFQCDGCSKKHDVFGAQGAQALKDRFGLKILGSLPIMSDFRQTIQAPSQSEELKLAVNQLIEEVEASTDLQKNIPEVSFDAKNIIIKWEGDEIQRVENRTLRLSCRCALCADELTGKLLVKDEQIPANIAPKEISLLGNYALGIKWSDGHSSGIYPYNRIKKL